MQIEAKCRICDKPLFVDSGDCPDDWAMRLVPMLTCNRCADLRAKRNDAMDGIKRACVMLIQLNHSKSKGSAERDAIREALTQWTKRYADWFSDFNLTRRVAWDQDFVTQLMEQPNRVDAILRTYRTLTRPLIQQEEQPA